MNYIHRIMIFAAMTTTTFTAGAQEVYENVDQQGVVEFSDQPGSGAKEVDVRPNVVDVAPVKSVKPSSSVSASGAAKAPAGKVQPEVLREDVTGEYYGDNEGRRETHREREKRMDRGEHGKEVIQQPAHKGTPRR